MYECVHACECVWVCVRVCVSVSVCVRARVCDKVHLQRIVPRLRKILFPTGSDEDEKEPRMT